MHAPLELLAGVVAAAANSPVAPSTPSTARTLPSSASPPASTALQTPLPRIASAPPPPPSAVSAPRAPSPMLSAPIPHLASPPSPPSDVTTSTAAMGPPSSGGGLARPQKRAKVRNGGKAQKRVLKRPFEAASVPVEKEVQARESEKSVTGGKEEKGSEDSQDNKRAMRAERNRQSAAASRERKKRHIKDLEERVKYLTEVNSTLQYRLDVEKQAWEEKEMVLQQEIARLRHQLSRESAFRTSPPQNHPMTLHHLTHRGPVTY